MKKNPTATLDVAQFQRNPRPQLRSALIVAAYLFAFIILDLITKQFEELPGIVAWYPPAGLTYTLLLVFGVRFSPAVTIALFVSSLFIYRMPQPPYALFLWAFIISLFYSAAAAFLRHRIHFDWQLRKLRDVTWFVFTTVFVSALLAILSVSSSALSGGIPQSDVLRAIFTWWIGETVGVLTVTPFLLIYVMPGLKRFAEGQPLRSPAGRSFPRPSLTVIGQVASLAFTLYWVFGVRVPHEFRPLFILSLPLFWVALQHGFKGVSAVIPALNSGIVFGHWFFGFEFGHLGELQLLMVVISIIGLIMGAIVTERRQSDAALQENRIQLEGIFKSTLDAIISIDEEQIIVIFNPAAEQMFGCPASEAIGQTLDRFLPEYVRTEHREHLRAFSQTNSTKRSMKTPALALTCVRSDGEAFPSEVSISQLELGGRKLYTAILRDVTERKRAEDDLRRNLDRARQSRQAMLSTLEDQKRAEEALRESESFVKTVLDNLPIGIAVNSVDPTVAFDYMNDNFPKFYRTTREKLASPDAFWNAVYEEPAFREEMKKRVLDDFASGNPERMSWVDVPITRKGEETAFISARNIPIPDKPLTISTVWDVTERKRTEEGIRRRAEEFAALYETSRDLNSQQDLGLLLRTIVERATKLFAAPRGLMYLYDATANDLELVVEKGALLPPGTRLKMSEGAAGMVMRTHEPFFVDDYSVWEGRAAQYNGIEIAAVLEVPMIHRGELIGVLGVSEVGSSTRRFAEEDARLLTLFASAAAGAVHNKRLLEETARQLSRMEALRHIDMAISASMDLRVTLDILLDHVTAQLKVDAAAVLLLNPHLHTLEFCAGNGFRTKAIEGTHLRLGESHAGRAALEGHLVHVKNLKDAPDLILTENLKEEGFVNYYALPLITKGQVKGVLEIFNRTSFTPDDNWLNFLETLAGQAAIAIDSAQLFENLQRSNTDLIHAYDRTIEGWSHALDLRDKETEGHSQRVTALTLKLARASGMTEAELVHVRRGALLHDIGKMGVPDSLLLKPGSLTDEEWVLMRKHPQLAYELLSPIAYLRDALDIPYCHHEKWDGTGYPRGLKGLQIPLAARLFAIVDVWDALRSDRPYRQGWPNEKAINHIKSLSGTHFDPKAAELFLNMMPELSKDQAE